MTDLSEYTTLTEGAALAIIFGALGIMLGVCIWIMISWRNQRKKELGRK